MSTRIALQLLMHLIFLRSSTTVLSKVEYSHWREIQDEYEDFMTSLGPWDVDDIADFFVSQYADEARWPFSLSQMQEFKASEAMTLISK